MKNVAVTSSVLDRILRLACDGLGKVDGRPLGVEVSGLLIGHGAEKEVLIDDFVTGEQISQPFYTSMTDAFLAKVAKSISDGEIKGRIYGSFHSHLGFGFLLSSIDVKTLKNMHRLSEDAVTLVVDPLTEERFRFFRYDPSTDSPRVLQVRVIG